MEKILKIDQEKVGVLKGKKKQTTSKRHRSKISFNERKSCLNMLCFMGAETQHEKRSLFIYKG